MGRQLRKLFGCVSAMAMLAIPLALAPFLAACGSASVPTAAPILAPTAALRPTTIAATASAEVITVVVPSTVVVVVKETVILTQAPPTPDVMPTEPPPPTPSSPGVAVQQELERLASGRIVYNPPAEMTANKTERVEVRITMDTAAPITTGLKGPGTPTVESIHVSSFMKVRLVGDTFDILAFSSEEQIVPAQGFTEWVWDVTPTQSGNRTLSLIVTALVKAPDAEGEKDLPIIERQILVKVNPGHVLTSFLSNNRGWIYPAVLVPFVAAFGRWLWGRQKARKQSPRP